MLSFESRAPQGWYTPTVCAEVCAGECILGWRAGVRPECVVLQVCMGVAPRPAVHTTALSSWSGHGSPFLQDLILALPSLSSILTKNDKKFSLADQR